MARWNSCNILDALTGTHRLWHFDAKGAGFVLNREHPAKPTEPLPGRLHAKSWSSLWRKKLNVAWFPPENVFLKVVELPASSFEETLSMVELQLEKLSPIPVTQIVWTLHMLPRRAAAADGAPDAQQTVVVVIVERGSVEEFLGQLENRGYLADRLEMPMLDQLEAADAKTDGVWVYPAVIAGQNAALVAWWIGGVLRDLSLVTLPPKDSAGESLKSQFARLAWAGELEGWLTVKPQWYLVADVVNAGLWGNALREQLGEAVQVVAPLTPAEMAARTAHRAARANNDRGNLMPPEFAARYHVQFVDRLWARGLMAVGLLYMMMVGIYLGVIYCPLIGMDARTTATEQQVVTLGPTYTNALQLQARYSVLKERQDLKYAALDCWQSVADKLPDGVTVQRMSFADGKKLTLGGSVPQADINKVIDFEDALRKTLVKGQPIFSATGGDPFSEHIMGGGTEVSWSFGLLLAHGEEAPK